MADPIIQSYCCHQRGNASNFAIKFMPEFHKDVYLKTCLISSFFGMIGAVCLIYISCKNNLDTTTRMRRAVRNAPSIRKRIIVWLAVADFCASFGVFVRSAIWTYENTTMPIYDDRKSVIFCAASSAWTQYFYTCTWLWTLCYAIDVRKTVLLKKASESQYHMFIWTTSAILTAVGLTLLYAPDANCHDVNEISTAIFRVLPNYFLTYTPILIVMIANPVLYYVSFKEVDRQIISRLRQVTGTERSILHTFKLKFFFLNVVFYICWLPNLVSGILLWSMWFNLPANFLIITWYILGVTNPLQALFNCIVYRQWSPSERVSVIERRQQILEAESFNETSPLLQNHFNLNEEQQVPLQQVISSHSVNACPCV